MTTKELIDVLDKELHYVSDEGINLSSLRLIIAHLKKLQADLKTATDALEFYADPFSWHDNEYGSSASVIEWEDCSNGDDCFNESESNYEIGGNKARAALAKIKEGT